MWGHLSHSSNSGRHVPPENDPESGRATIPVGGGCGGSSILKKSALVRPWLRLDSTGQAQVEKDGKYGIMRRTGLPTRDLRILDPLLSSPSTVLGRNRAIVINLEHIKAIITAQEVLLLNSRDPSVCPFVEELQRTFTGHHHATKVQYQKEDNKGEGKVLPFEFVALEACLEAACSCLENEARILELEAHSAVDKLTSEVSPLNLEIDRQIKSRLVAITGRVQKVRDTLKYLLDDDEDMAEMYLTKKLVQQQLDNSSASFMNERDDMVDEVLPSDMAVSAMSKQLDVEDLEMILEAYFVQIDGTLNKLSMLRDYMDDTDDYIKFLQIDEHNKLLQEDVRMTTGTLAVGAAVGVTGIFGMNINIKLFDDNRAGMREFVWTVVGVVIGARVLYEVLIACFKYKRLL